MHIVASKIQETETRNTAICEASSSRKGANEGERGTPDIANTSLSTLSTIHDHKTMNIIYEIVFLLLYVLQPTSAFVLRPFSPATSHGSSTTLFKKSGTKKKKIKDGTICVNRQARRNYEILDTLEAGIALKGTEVKSIRDGKMQLQDSFVKITKDGRGCSLMNCHIGKHSMAGAYFQHEERRVRQLLVHAMEAKRLKKKTEQSGFTIVPLKAYFNDDNRVKLQIALCRGKNVRDKRADIKERDMKRETGRIMKNFRI